MASNVGVRKGAAMATDWINRYFEAWDGHDADGVVSFMTTDAVYEDLALGERYEGTQAIKAAVEGLESTISTDYRIQLRQVIVTDDAYSFEWTMSGTNDRADAQRGLPATGQRFEFPGVSVGVLRGGKIKDNRDYWNLAAYLTQVGLMPAPGSPDAGTV